MPESQLGRVFWSAAAGQFFQEGRVGALTRIEGLAHLREVTIRKTARFIDERGRFVPDPVSLIPDRFEVRFIDRTRTATAVPGDLAYAERAPRGAHYTTLAIAVTPEGRVEIVRRSFPAHQPISVDQERRKIAAAINERITDPALRQDTDKIWRLVRAFFHYRIR